MGVSGAPTPRVSRRRRVAQVALGTLSSRIVGLVRMRVLAHFLGVSALGDVWTAAMRGPNVVQNLLGEQALSAAFIPVYVRKLAAGDEEDRSAVAAIAAGRTAARRVLLAAKGHTTAAALAGPRTDGVLVPKHR